MTDRTVTVFVKREHRLGGEHMRVIKVTNYAAHPLCEIQGLNKHGYDVSSHYIGIHRDDVPTLIAALQAAIAGPLGRLAIKQDHPTMEIKER